jgi:hypothetical protein
MWPTNWPTKYGGTTVPSSHRAATASLPVASTKHRSVSKNAEHTGAFTRTCKQNANVEAVIVPLNAAIGVMLQNDLGFRTLDRSQPRSRLATCFASRRNSSSANPMPERLMVRVLVILFRCARERSALARP